MEESHFGGRQISEPQEQTELALLNRLSKKKNSQLTSEWEPRPTTQR